MTVALNNFKEIIPVNDIEKAFKLKEKYNAVLAGEKKVLKLDKFDVSNSPYYIQNFKGNTLILKTTNGTKVLENMQNNNKNADILIGSSINAKAIAEKSLEMAEDEIQLIMAGRHQNFTIEDGIGAGIIINEIVNLAKIKEIPLDITESGQVAQMIAEDHKIAQDLIYTSNSADILRSLGYPEDIDVCAKINESNIVPIYKNNKITQL
nr:2-phosphosulfolactate phosphatase [Methanosphaera sp. WGK6]